MMPGGLAEWEQLARTFQGFATGIAILGGGAWALLRFLSLREIERARVELEKEKRGLREQPVLDLSMAAGQVSMPGGALGVLATVTAENKGTRPARMAYESEPALTVYSVHYSDENLPTFETQQELTVRLASNPNYPAKATIIREKQTQKIPFLIQVPCPGLYFLSFRAVVPEADRGAAIEVGMPEHRTLSWTAKCYINVGSDEMH